MLVATAHRLVRELSESTTGRCGGDVVLVDSTGAWTQDGVLVQGKPRLEKTGRKA